MPNLPRSDCETLIGAFSFIDFLQLSAASGTKQFALGFANQIRPTKGNSMLLTIAVILLILWALGFVAFHVGGGLIHLLLVIAAVVIIYQLVTGRRSV